MRDLIFQENSINLKLRTLDKYIADVELFEVKLDFCEKHERHYINDQIKSFHNMFNSDLKELYLLVLNYLEKQNSTQLLSKFKNDMDHIPTLAKNSILQLEYDDFGHCFISEELIYIRKILIPFEAFDESVNKNIGLIYLENILKSTAFIINELSVVPTNESNVYNTVKHVLKAAFPDYISAAEPFYKEAKCYKPDILLRSLNTAVEYKYATDEKRLIKTMEEIIIDVAGYSNHHIYKTFYAVFYVTPGICTTERFDILWNSYKFPDNWKPIYVIGS